MEIRSTNWWVWISYRNSYSIRQHNISNKTELDDKPDEQDILKPLATGFRRESLNGQTTITRPKSRRHELFYWCLDLTNHLVQLPTTHRAPRFIRRFKLVGVNEYLPSLLGFILCSPQRKTRHFLALKRHRSSRWFLHVFASRRFIQRLIAVEPPAGTLHGGVSGQTVHGSASLCASLCTLVRRSWRRSTYLLSCWIWALIYN